MSHSHTQSHTVLQSVSQGRNPKLAPFRHSPAASVCLFCNARCTEFQQKCKELLGWRNNSKEMYKVSQNCIPISPLLVYTFCEEETSCLVPNLVDLLGALAYLIFVIFLHEQNFGRIKFTPKKLVNYDKIHRKLPIFCVIMAKYTVNCQFFALNL